MSNICWVETVADADATDGLADMYDAVRYNGRVQNLYLAGSLFPAPVAHADAWYKALLHDPDAPLALWESELAASYVAILTHCHYALANHGANFCRRHDNPDEAKQLLDQLKANPDSRVDDVRINALLAYTRKLTLQPTEVEQTDIVRLREARLTDAEIVHLNHVVASFAYWVRLINGLGIQLDEGPVGLDI